METFTDLSSYNDGRRSRYTNVSCTGDETRLIDCTHDRTTNRLCGAKRVGVRCHEESESNFKICKCRNFVYSV